MSVHYSIIPQPYSHLFAVTLQITNPVPSGQMVSMPAWIPGSYMIRDFAKNVVEIAARDDHGQIALKKLDKQTWQAAPCNGTLTLTYSVYAWDLSVRGAHLDTRHGYFNGTSLFLRVHGQDDGPCTIDVSAPSGLAFEEWHVATTLARDGAPENGFGRYRAIDYDELVDHPVEMGTFVLARFNACGVPHEVAITGQHKADTARLTMDLKRICEYQIRLFGEPAPMERYLFQVMAIDDGYGGLEHRSSTSLLCSRNDLPRAEQKEISENYRTFLGLCSHEYFHTWNVKRIKPAAFNPYDLSREVHTSLLWAFEGFTAYYDDLSLVRAGIITPVSYLELLGQTITRLLRSPGRHKQSVAESSFDAWTKFYKADENGPNAIVSYYVKGAVIALALDLHIRLTTDGARSLDDLMRALWEKYGKTSVGVTEDALETLAAEVTGGDLRSFFDHAVRGKGDIALAPLLGEFGIQYNVRPADSVSDKGGKPAKESACRVALGVRTGDNDVGARVINAFEGGSAQLAGLSPGDVILAIGGLRVTHKNLEKILSLYSPSDTVELHAFRRDELLHFTVTLQTPPSDTCYLTLTENAEESTLTRRKSWLGVPGDGNGANIH